MAERYKPVVMAQPRSFGYVMELDSTFTTAVPCPYDAAQGS
jgi:hypothetical protein